MSGIVIIGTGLAGYTLAKELRKLDTHTPLHLITRDDGSFYSKPMLSNAIAKQKTAATLVNFTSEQMTKQLNAEIWANTLVTRIDSSEHVVECGPRSIEYSKLVLAVGASQFLPPMQGDGVEDIVTVNSLNDYAQLRERLARVEHIGIIGPGLIGCEFANDLIEGGKKVSVIGPGKTPLERLLPHDAGKMLQDKLAALGVEWHLGTVAKAIHKSDKLYNIELSNDQTVQVQLVLSATGLRPNVLLAKEMGAETKHGIVVDRYLQTTLSEVYALGDCAEVDGLVLPFVLPIMHSARALAKTLAGEATKVNYPAMPVVVKTPAHNIVVSPPAKNAQGEWQVDVTEGGVKCLYKSDKDELLGFALTGSGVAEKQALTKLLPSLLE